MTESRIVTRYTHHGRPCAPFDAPARAYIWMLYGQKSLIYWGEMNNAMNAPLSEFFKVHVRHFNNKIVGVRLVIDARASACVCVCACWCFRSNLSLISTRRQLDEKARTWSCQTSISNGLWFCVYAKKRKFLCNLRVVPYCDRVGLTDVHEAIVSV
jgi:hypothetical protein